jgi:hypothetical protein
MDLIFWYNNEEKNHSELILQIYQKYINEMYHKSIKRIKRNILKIENKNFYTIDNISLGESVVCFKTLWNIDNGIPIEINVVEAGVYKHLLEENIYPDQNYQDDQLNQYLKKKINLNIKKKKMDKVCILIKIDSKKK